MICQLTSVTAGHIFNIITVTGLQDAEVFRWNTLLSGYSKRTGTTGKIATDNVEEEERNREIKVRQKENEGEREIAF